MLSGGEKGVLQQLVKAYTLVNERQILDFLGHHPHLGPILRDAPDVIQTLFGGQVQLKLEVHRDPEEDWEELFIVIQTLKQPAQALQLLDQLDEAWLASVEQQADYLLNVTVEPVDDV